MQLLSKIYCQNPNFPYLSEVLRKGISYKFTTELNEDQHLKEVEASLQYGNHKSATNNRRLFEEYIAKDVKFGFALPINKTAITNIPKCLVQPGGLAKQFTLSPDGTCFPQEHLTHDLIFEHTGTNISVNNRLNLDEYPEMYYGHCLSQVIHLIVALRWRFPKEKIFIAKFDFSAAYRRSTQSATTAVQSILVSSALTFIYLCMTFGGAANPPAWSSASEMICDLANKLPQITDWDPLEVNNPDQKQDVVPKFRPQSEPTHPANPMAVVLPIKENEHASHLGKNDCYLNDIIAVMLDRPSAIGRWSAAMPLAVFLSL